MSITHDGGWSHESSVVRKMLCEITDLSKNNKMNYTNSEKIIVGVEGLTQCTLWIIPKSIPFLFTRLINDGISQSQEIMKHAKSVVKCELHVSKLVYMREYVHACSEPIFQMPLISALHLSPFSSLSYSDVCTFMEQRSY